MPLQNRVTPTGELVAVPERGNWMGNRGRLHDDRRTVVRHHAGRRWISCRLEFRGRRRPVMAPGRYTELFFLDEATAFAAGHRPCVECRRPAWQRLTAALAGQGVPVTKVDELDVALHAERLRPGGDRKRRHRLSGAGLPDGTMIELEGRPWLLAGGEARRWTAAGYPDAVPRPAGELIVITPPTLLAGLRGGYELDRDD